MKNTFAISTITFLLFVVVVFGGALFFSSKSSQNTNVKDQNSSNTNTGKIFSTEDVAIHNTESDCWLIISGKVYDVTQSIEMHPGGAEMITKNCGTDATTFFNTDSVEGHDHSTTARESLLNFYVGEIK